VQLTFQLTTDDYRDGLVAWRSLKSWRRWGIRGAGAFFGLGFVVFALQLFVASATVISVVPGLVLSAGFLILIWAGPSLSGRRQFRNTPSAHDPMTIEASDAGLEIHSVHADSKVAWSAYMAWGECKTVFVILPQPRIYVPIPKRAFTAEQENGFRELLRRNIKPQPK
jgi:YcxB-like protein